GDNITIEGFAGTAGDGTSTAPTLTVSTDDGTGTFDNDATLDGTNVAFKAVGTLQFDSATTFSITGGPVDELVGQTVAQQSSISDIDVLTAANAQDAISVIDGAIANIDSQRAQLGAVQNRFESTISNLQNISENVSASRARIVDTDYAAESANLAKNQIMQQAGTAMLAQANQLPQAVLSLLG